MKKPRNIEQEFKTMTTEGGGVLEVRVYSGPTVLGGLLSKDEDTIRRMARDGRIIGHLLKVWGQDGPNHCWICGKDADFPMGIVVISGHCNDPGQVLGGYICTECYDPKKDMTQLAIDVLKEHDAGVRQLVIHPEKGHS